MGGAGHVTRIVAPKAERYGLTPVNVSIDPHDSAGSVVRANVVRRNGAIGEVRCGGDGRAGGRASWGDCTTKKITRGNQENMNTIIANASSRAFD